MHFLFLALVDETFTKNQVLLVTSTMYYCAVYCQKHGDNLVE